MARAWYETSTHRDGSGMNGSEVMTTSIVRHPVHLARYDSRPRESRVRFRVALVASCIFAGIALVTWGIAALQQSKAFGQFGLVPAATSALLGMAASALQSPRWFWCPYHQEDHESGKRCA